VLNAINLLDNISEKNELTCATHTLQLTDRFNLLWCPSSVVSARQIASFLDPRYKDLEHETVDVREEIRTRVKNLINEMAENNSDEQIESSVTKKKKTVLLNFCMVMK